MGLAQKEIDFAELEKDRLVQKLDNFIDEAIKDADKSKSHPAKEVISTLRQKYA